MCVGSYASREDNDVEAIVEEFAQKVNFVHLRNVQKSNESFIESHHLEGNVNMYKVISALLCEQQRRHKIGVKDEGKSFYIKVDHILIFRVTLICTVRGKIFQL